MRSLPFLVLAALLALAGSATASPPTCTDPPEHQVREGGALHLWLSGYCHDADGDRLTFAISTLPEHGDVSGIGPFGDIAYWPHTGFVGADALAFTASDGTDTTAPVTVPIQVTVNVPPSCPATIQAEVARDVEKELWPTGCSDPDTPFFPLDVELVGEASHGTVTVGDPPWTFLYAPDPGYVGPDSFTFRVLDDVGAASDLATYELTVVPNSPPSCQPLVRLQVAPGGMLPLDHRNSCTDPDGDEMLAMALDGPHHGWLSFEGPTVVYRPNPGFAGVDRIDYLVQDEHGAESAPAAVEITVGGPAPGGQPSGGAPPGRPAGAPPRGTPPDRTAPAVATAFPSGLRLARVRKSGLKVRLRSSESGRARIELLVDKRTARALRLRRRPRGPVLVGAVEGSIQAGTTNVTVRLTPRARRALRRVRSVRLRLVAAVTDVAGNRRDHVRVLTLRR